MFAPKTRIDRVMFALKTRFVIGLSITNVIFPHLPKTLKTCGSIFDTNAVYVGITHFYVSAENEVLL